METEEYYLELEGKEKDINELLSIIDSSIDKDNNALSNKEQEENLSKSFGKNDDSELRTSDSISLVSKFSQKMRLQLPLFADTVQAGFPSPAEDYIEDHIDLNQYLIKHPQATFFIKVSGNSMIDAGIFNDDILIIDRAIDPIANKVVIAVIDGELTIKRLKKKNGKWFLKAENQDYEDIHFLEEEDLLIWGVAIYSIHKL
ncbi:MAG: translesion error-prone DNA polymerase V autoproteolytic subunit [Candidatus Cloacimonadota bacterium]|nr:translesion error-prone DNA polymerase V autoproteolytic subunit [Candidatus Cloacimonadota bacterium]